MKKGSLKQEPIAAVADAAVPAVVSVAVTPVAPVVKPTTPSDEISVDDFLGLGKSAARQTKNVLLTIKIN